MTDISADAVAKTQDPAKAKQYKVYGYRWVVLATFMLINLTIQLLWITYAPITNPAASYYHVSELYIGALSMSFMVAFIPLSIPVSWIIDTFGFRLAASIGAVLMGVFALARGFAGANFTFVFLSTIGIGIAQPFLLNTWTTLAAKWFSIDERATAVGLITVANLIGAAVGMVVTPILIQSMSIAQVQFIYGAVSAATSVLFLIFAREKPATPPCPPGHDVRALMWDGLKHALQIKPFMLFMVVAFIALGIFNGLSTWIQVIIQPRGFTPEDAGIVGAVFLVSGILGAGIMPIFSDKHRKRQRYLFISIIGSAPGMLGLTFATTLPVLLISAFVLGFFLISTFPIGMQYAAEITYPTPEGTSNGLIQLFGQASVVFVLIMQLVSVNGSFTPAMFMSIGLLVVCIAVISQLKDAKPVDLQPAVVSANTENAV